MNRFIAVLLFFILPIALHAGDAPPPVLQKIEPVVQSGHANGISYVAFTPNEKYLFSFSWGHGILWDIETGKKLRDYVIPYDIKNAILSPNGKTLFSLGKFIDIETGKTIRTLPDQQEVIQSCVFHPDGNTLITGHSENSDQFAVIRFWNVSDGQLIREFSGHKSLISSVAVDPQGKRVVSGDADGTVIVWDYESGKKIYVLEKHKETDSKHISSLRFSPDGKRLLSTAVGITFLWDMETGDLSGECKGHDTVCFTKDGSKVIIDYQGKTTLYDAKTLENISTLDLGHRRASVTSSTFSPSGKLFVSGSSDQTIVILDWNSGKIMKVLGERRVGSGICRADINHDGSLVVSAVSGGYITLYDSRTGFIHWQKRAHSKDINVIKFSPEGNFILTGSTDQTAKLWKTQSGDLVQEYEIGGEVETACFHLHNPLIAFGGDFGTVIVDQNDGAVVKKIETGKVKEIYFHPTELLIATAGWNGISIWDAQSAQKMREFTSSCFKSVSFSPDGKHLVGGTDSGTSHSTVWNASTGEEVFYLNETSQENEEPECVFYNHDGKLIVCCFRNNRILLWNTESGMLEKSLNVSNPEYFYSASMDASNNILVAGAGETCMIMDVSQCVPIRYFKNYPFSRIDKIHFNDAMECLFVGENSRRICIWNLKAGLHQGNLWVDDGSLFGGIKVYDKHGSLFLWTKRRLLICDSKTHSYIDRLSFPDENLELVALSPDASMIAFLLEQKKPEPGYMLQLIDSKDHSLINSRFLSKETKESKYLFEWDGNYVVRTVYRKVERNAESNQSKKTTKSHAWDIRKNTISTSYPEPFEYEQFEFIQSDGTTVKFTDLFRTLEHSKKNMTFRKTDDGAIKLYGENPRRELCSLYSFSGGQDWLVVTPEGLFDGTPGGQEMVSFRVGEGLNVHPVSAFYNDLHYSDLLAAIWRGERPKPDVALKDQLPPDIRVLSPKEATDVTATMAEIEVEIVDRGGGIEEPNITVNGSGVIVREKPVVSEKTLRWRFTVPLGTKDNEILVRSATADGQIRCHSTPIKLYNRLGEPKPPELYVLTIGVSDYADGDEHDLPCARADAEALAEVFRRRGAELYEKVHVQTLVDADATADKIEKALKTIQESAGVEDVLLVSFAGHGVTEGRLYYFIPHNFRFTGDSMEKLLEEKGIGNNKLEYWIKSIPARKRILVYDTCQSAGAFSRSGLARKQAIDKLHDRAGCFTISAASSDAAAYELATVGHGALTYALLAALGETPQSLLDGRAPGVDGQIPVGNWLGYAREKVPDLTKRFCNKEQYVEVRGFARDFPILLERQSLQ